jgi:hypothetical protein
MNKTVYFINLNSKYDIYSYINIYYTYYQTTPVDIARMDFVKLLYTPFKEKYSALLEDIESAIFIFIEEIIMSKDIPLEAQINYADISFEVNLKELLDSIAFGLKSINIPEEKINQELVDQYQLFEPVPGNSTYVDWIMNSFQPRIQQILFSEILQYIADYPSVLKGLVDFGLLNDDHLKKLRNIKIEDYNLVSFLGWYYTAREQIENKILNNDEDYANLLKFNDPEKDLQSFYLFYRIAELLKIENEIDFRPVMEFLLNNTEKWAIQNPNISEKYPMTMLVGIYLALTNNINLDKEYITSALKKILVKLVNSFSSPVIEDTFLTYYIINACELMELKLSSKLIDGITRYELSLLNEDLLKSFSTARLGLICEIYNKFDQYDTFPTQIKSSISKIILGRLNDESFLNYDLDFMPCTEAIYGSALHYQLENNLDNYPFQETMDFLNINIKENLSMFDLGLTGQVADIYYGLLFFEHMNTANQTLLSKHTGEFLMGIEFEDEKPAKMEKYSVSVPSISKIQKSQPVNAEIPQTPTELSTPVTPTKEWKPVIKQVPTEREIYVPKRPLPSRFWDFFGDYPILIPDIVDEIDLNIEAIVQVKDATFLTLETLHQWVVCIKILNIEFPISKDEIYERTGNFRMDHGFGIEAIDERMPDVKNTFFGLCVYSEFDLLDRLNLYKIQKYLINEAQNLNEYSLLDNDYIFMCLRLLERKNIPFNDYTHLIDKLLGIDIQAQNEMINGLTDIVHYINIIKCINPNYDLKQLNDNYLTDVQIAQEDDGSISKLPTQTAKVLIALHELGLQGVAPAKFMIKYLQYDSNYFVEAVRKEPIGWESDPLGYQIELGICYWTLMALTLIYPSIPPLNKSIICPKCKKFFNKRPKFCNNCGTRF